MLERYLCDSADTGSVRRVHVPSLRGLSPGAFERGRHGCDTANVDWGGVEEVNGGKCN